MTYYTIHVFIALLGFVGIVSGQNNAPITTNTISYFLVEENAEIGSFLFTLTAKDADGDPITFVPTTDTTKETVTIQDPFLIDKDTTEYGSNVTLNTTLDVDEKPRRLFLFFDASDGRDQSPIKITLVLRDVNDNPPLLIDLPYRTSVPEDFEIGKSLYQFNAKDPDNGKGRSILYSMKANREGDEDHYDATFELDNRLGVVTLKRQLDYETRSFYHFKVSAKDEGSPPCPGPDCLCKGKGCDGTVADFIITIEDVEDTPPIFDRPSYSGTVPENKEINSTILTTKATDGDRAVAHPSKIEYFLSDQNVPFSVNSDGEIKVARELDADGPLREKGGLYIFNVTARENPTNQSASALVFITVEDSNDCPPELNSSQFTGNVLENTPKGVPLSMNPSIEVTDCDQGVNSRFRIFVKTMDGQPENDFYTIPSQTQILRGSSSITIVVSNSTLLDFEKIKTTTFKLVAREVVGTDAQLGNRTSEAEVTINIMDTNDNNPIFEEQQGTTYNVSEDVKTGHVIHTFKANDADSGEFGRVEYSMEDNSVFRMESDGNLTVKKKLDREEQSSYFVVITATDNPNAPDSQQRKTQLRLTIRVTDVNDNPPKWETSSARFSVTETEKVNATVGVLRATDRDSGKNGELEYKVSPKTNGSSYFNVKENQDNETELYISSNLRGSPGFYVVDVVAQDKGDEPKNATLKVEVFVADINLDAPIFIKPNRSTGIAEIEVWEEEPIGTVLYQLKAKDEGTGPDDRVKYTLLPSTNADSEYFQLGRKSGNLTVDKRLNREWQEVYEIQVKAEDNGFPVPLSTTLTLTIKLKDKNDSEPTFDGVSRLQKMEVIEGIMNASIGMVNNATDKDLIDQICYYLCDNQSVPLNLNKQNGHLCLDGEVDREEYSEFNVKVLASSTCDAQPSKNCSGRNPDSILSIRVAVQDVDDNPPKFTHKEYSRSITFDEQIGTEVISLKDLVTDKDSSSTNNKFRLKGKALLCQKNAASACSSSKDPFNVEDNGSIKTNRLFQANLVGYFLLKVEVYAPAKDSFTDDTEVKIYIVSNEQRVRLVFDKKTPSQVKGFIDNLINALSDTLNLNITVGAIKTHVKSDNKPDPSKTDAFIYASKKGSDAIMSATELQNALDFSTGARTLLLEKGVQEVQGLSLTEDDDEDEMLKRLFIILVTVMAILVIALILVLINIIRMYRRRLKAATTMAYVSPKEQEMYEHPGTNKYYTAENPLFGKEIKAPELEEDRNSTNSLDVNEVDQKSPSKTAYDNVDPEEEQEVVLQIMDSSLSTPQHNGYPNQNARLNKVLEEYDNSVHGSGKTKAPPPPPLPYMNGVGQNNNSLPPTNGYGIPGLGQDIQEGVTRFSDDGSKRKSYEFPETIHGNLEYTEI